MKTGRNDPCPCGSGKKYKKCCLAKDQASSSQEPAAVLLPPSVVASARSTAYPPSGQPHPAGPTALARAAEPPPPPLPPDPVAERAASHWREFESESDDGRIALFLKTLEDAELMTDDLAFEMLNRIHSDAVKNGGRARFAEYVNELRERWPEMFDQSAHYYRAWCLQDALAENRHEVVPTLARELAARADRDIDVFNRSIAVLEYHGQLPVLVEALRLAWPNVKSSDNIVPWGITEFAEKGARYEILDYLEHTAAPDPTDPGLLDRVRFFVEEPREDYLREFIGDLTGKSGEEWQVEDFALNPPRQRSHRDWDAEDDEGPTRDQGAINLLRLISAFVGFLRREQGVPFPRGELVRRELYLYFVRRDAGDLDPQPSLLEQAMHPNRKLPKPPRPAHPLCPERVTLEVHLARMMDMMSARYHTAAALFQAIPAWLRFLESHRLIDSGTSKKVMAELLPLHASLRNIWEQFSDDPHLYHQGQSWLTLP